MTDLDVVKKRCDGLGLTHEDYLRWVRESRLAQGLTAHIDDDPAAVERIAHRLRVNVTTGDPAGSPVTKRTAHPVITPMEPTT